jgi:hypothetical protein
MSITLLLEYTVNGTMRRFIERLLSNITRLGNFGLSTKDLGGNVVQYQNVSSANGHDRPYEHAVPGRANIAETSHCGIHPPPPNISVLIEA